MTQIFTILQASLAFAVLSTVLVAAEGIAGEVLRVDHKKQCLWLDWNNNTEKTVCWTDKSKFSVLETDKAAKPSEVRKGSYVRMEGEDKGGTYWATEIVIWEAQSKPSGN